MIAERISSGSLILPGPVVPQARRPSLGPMKRTSRDSSVLMLACSAGELNIRLFIAGAISFSHEPDDAIAIVVTRSSAIPQAILAITFAVAGAIIIRSARSVSEMCCGSWSAPSVQSVVNTLFRVTD